jgi:hypothetical protein
MAKTYTVQDEATKSTVTFMWDGKEPPTDADLAGIFAEANTLKQNAMPQQNTAADVPEWGARNPNLYGAYGAGREILRTGMEGVGTAAGAAGGAFVPVPGAPYVGAGLGYAGAKRAANALLGEPIDTSAGGIATDVALGGVLQGAGRLIGKIPGVNKVLSPAVADVGPAPSSPVMDKAAYALMEKSMKIPPSVKAAPREIAIKTALKEDIPVTPGGLGRVKGLLDQLEGKMDSVVAANPDAPIKIDSVLGPVRDLQDWAGKTVNGKELSSKIEHVIKNFKKQYGDEITVAQAQELKQNTNAFLRKSYGELKPVAEEAQKQIVRGLKDRIAQEIPEITGVNARYSDLKVLESALERAVNRTGNWDWFSLSAGMAGVITGGATGSLPKAAWAVALWRTLKSPNIQTRLALILKNAGAGPKANAMANTIADSVYNKYVKDENQ